MRGVVRGLAWAVGGLLLVPIVAYGILVLVNWRDEPPSADVRRFEAMLRERAPVEDAANGYVYALGFAAPTGVDPVAFGARRREWLEQHAANARGKPMPGVETNARAVRLPATQRLLAACGSVPADCERALQAEPGALAAATAAEALPLARYEALLQRRAWRETVPLDALAPMPRFSDLLDAQLLYLLRTRELARDGDVVAVRRRLEADLAYWRVVLASSDLLITRMIATAAIQRHFEFGGLALRALPAPAADAVPPSWMRPFSTAERSMRRAFAGEWRLMDATLRAAAADAATRGPDAIAPTFGQRLASRLSRPLLRVQATSNMSAARMGAFAALSELPVERIPRAVAARLRASRDARSPWHAYNPVGHLLVAIAPERILGDYLYRVADLEGLRRAALLAQSLRGRGAAGADAARAIRASDLRDPYTAAPFGWDAARGVIVVDGHARGPRARHEVPL